MTTMPSQKKIPSDGIGSMSQVELKEVRGHRRKVGMLEWLQGRSVSCLIVVVSSHAAR